MAGHVFTFYSYKGGVGRTMSLANMGALLASWGRKVLCIDWDLEAPGLAVYFQSWIDADDQQRPGLTEWIQAHADAQEPDWRDYLTPVRLPEGELSLMRAGRRDESYIRRMQALDWEELYDEHQLGLFLEEARQQWLQEFDFILVDSRTGITDTGGICTVQLPDTLVVLMTANEQSLQGCLDIVERAMKMRQGLPFEREQLQVLPVLSRFEMRSEYEQAQVWLSRFSKALEPWVKAWAPRGIKPRELLLHLRIPHVPYWNFGERLPVVEKGTQDPEDMGYALETLTALLSSRLEKAEVLLVDRGSLVEQQKRTASDQVRVLDRYEALDRLMKLLPAQFELLLFFLGVDTSVLPGTNAALSQRAIALLQLMELRNNGLEELSRALQQI